MDSRTLTALQGSIKKWEAIVTGDGADEGAENCPLCAEFQDNWDEETQQNCAGCPVSAKTGLAYCSRSPYEEWTKAGEDQRTPDSCTMRATTPELVALAQVELDFLRGLLPDAPRTSP